MAITYHAGRRIQGLSTDIVDTPTLDEDFSTYTTQGEADAVWIPTNTSTDVNLTTDQVEIRTSTSAQGGYISLNGGSNISDSEWICRFRFKINTKQPCVIIVSDNTSTNSATLIDGIGLRITDTTNYVDVECPNGEASDSATIDHRFTHTPANQEYYIEIIRLSESSCKVNLYEDAYSTLIESSGTITGISGITSLKYLVFQSRTTNTQNTDIDDIQFYNGVSSLTSKPTNVQSGSRFEETDTRKIYYGAIPLTFEDDFTSSGATSHTANNTTVGGWTTSDYLECKVNGSNDNMDISLGETATNDSITYDLGSNASSNWVLRFEFDFSTLTESVENIAWIGLSSVDYSNTSTTTQNFTGMQFEYTGSQHMVKLHDRTSGSLHVAVDTTGADLTTNWNTTDKMYVELIKNGTSYTRKVSTGGYVGDGGTEIVASITGTTGDHADLRYITFRNRVSASRSGTIDGTVDNLKWYNGVTSTDFTWTEEV